MKYLLVVLLISGCSHLSPKAQERRLLASHQTACDRAGFARDSDGWRLCVLQQHQAEENRRAMAAQTFFLRQPRPCTWVGSLVRC
jgi:hypothetical protein